METIVEIAKIITAVGVIATFMWNIFMQFMKFKMYDKKIKALTAEQCLQTRLFDAVLDGLEQLGCNHSVPDARKELNDFLNERAHEVE